MIYIISDYDPFPETSYIAAVIDTDVDIEGEYKKFIHKEAENREIVINKHWYNMMNHEDYHVNLTDLQYKNKNKMWIKFLKKNTLLTFVKNKLNLPTNEYKQVFNSYN